MKPILRFELPRPTPTLNVWMRWHWRKQRRYAKRLAQEVYWLVYNKVPAATTKRRVVITRLTSGKPDRDNVIGGCKGLLDALVSANILKDDSEEWCEVVYKSQPGSGMVVEVFEV